MSNYEDEARRFQLVRNHGGASDYPECPIFFFPPVTVAKKIRTNPFGAILYAAKCIADREAVLNYVRSLPVDERLREDIYYILLDAYRRGIDRVR